MRFGFPTDTIHWNILYFSMTAFLLFAMILYYIGLKTQPELYKKEDTSFKSWKIPFIVMMSMDLIAYLWMRFVSN